MLLLRHTGDEHCTTECWLKGPLWAAYNWLQSISRLEITMYISSGSFSALCSSSSRNWVIEAGFALLNVWLVILQSQKFLCLLTLQQHSWRYIAQVGTSQRKEQRVPSSGLNCQFSHLDCFQVFLEILCLELIEILHLFLWDQRRPEPCAACVSHLL